ncbi:MAG: DUF134 domain-containing protein [Candidatus Heimdallarchaeota archaeon]|nr:MAG: DUF134 domain-containing protein [Candidatus Heimdallarchaeota archaeon]
MPRPRISRTIQCDPTHPYFKPRGIPLKDLPGEVEITLEELETMRLSDLEGLSQKEVGNEMKISQSTVSRHLEEAHRKIAKALVLGYAVRIANPVDFYHCDSCGHTWRFRDDQDDLEKCEKCHSPKFHLHEHTYSEDPNLKE